MSFEFVLNYQQQKVVTSANYIFPLITFDILIIAIQMFTVNATSSSN